MSVLASTLVSVFEPWADAYGDSKVLQVAVVFLHLAGIVIGGGTALALDRAAFRLPEDGGARRAHLAALASSHRVVLAGLAVTIVSGLLLFAADVETYLGSVVYWVKMGLFVLLLGNGLLMQRAERRLAGDPADAGGWGALRRSAAVSLVLWLAVLLAGVIVVNAS